jgi:hypothetical protein
MGRMSTLAGASYNIICDEYFHHPWRDVDAYKMLCTACRGFTKFARVDYVKWKEENRLVNDGVTAKVRCNSGLVK